MMFFQVFKYYTLNTAFPASPQDGACNVLVPGFYDGVASHLQSTGLLGREEWAGEFSLEGYKAALGVPQLTHPVSGCYRWQCC